MTDFLMTTWDGAGTTPPLMSVARALVERGHGVRVMADPVLRGDVEAAGAEHVSWTRAPHRTRRTPGNHLARDWEVSPAKGLARLIDGLSVGPAAEFAADVRAELECRPAAAVLTEVMLFGPLVAAEAAGVPAVVLNPTINLVPAPGVPPIGMGLRPSASPVGRLRDRAFGTLGARAWNRALPALNAARAEHGLPPLDHVLDQGRSAARVLVLTSAAFDFMGPLPPVVKHVGPRLDDVAWADEWTPPAGDEPLVLAALSSDYQAQEGVLQRIADALGKLPVRGVVTTGLGIRPDTIQAPPNVQVVRSGAHGRILREASVVVTHCGHGTTLKALAAGVPVVGLPMGRDQMDVAARVVHAGAGRRLRASASPAAIARAVTDVLQTPGYRQQAQRIAADIARERATDLAVAEIEALAGNGARLEPVPA